MQDEDYHKSTTYNLGLEYINSFLVESGGNAINAVKLFHEFCSNCFNKGIRVVVCCKINTVFLIMHALECGKGKLDGV